LVHLTKNTDPKQVWFGLPWPLLVVWQWQAAASHARTPQPTGGIGSCCASMGGMPLAYGDSEPTQQPAFAGGVALLAHSCVVQGPAMQAPNSGTNA